MALAIMVYLVPETRHNAAPAKETLPMTPPTSIPLLMGGVSASPQVYQKFHLRSVLCICRCLHQLLQSCYDLVDFLHCRCRTLDFLLIKVHQSHHQPLTTPSEGKGVLTCFDKQDSFWYMIDMLLTLSVYFKRVHASSSAVKDGQIASQVYHQLEPSLCKT